MANLVKLEKQLLAHDLQRADFSGILLLRKEDLTVATLSDLCQDLEVTMSKADASLSEVSTLTTRIFLPQIIVSLFIGLGRRRNFGFERIKSSLTATNISQEVEVVVQEV